MNRRDWLVSKGLAKPGRGKFSNAAKAALAEAESSGIVFDDSAPAPRATRPAKEKPVRDSEPVVTITDDVVMFENEMPHFGKEWYYVNAKGKKKPLSNRAVCTGCRYSLVAHTCDNPRVLAPNGEFVTAVV